LLIKYCINIYALDYELGHMAYRRVSLINLYLQTKFCSNQKVFVDGRTDGQMDRDLLRLDPS